MVAFKRHARIPVQFRVVEVSNLIIFPKIYRRDFLYGFSQFTANKYCDSVITLTPFCKQQCTKVY